MSAIYEYHVPGDLLPRVESGEWVPVAVIGLWGPARSFEETGVKGTLLIEASRATETDAPLLFAEVDGDTATPWPESFAQLVAGLRAG